MYIFDLEGTLSDCEHRDHLLPKNGSRNYDDFHKEFPKDEPIHEMISLFHVCSETHKVIILTGMMEKHRNMAIGWLTKNGIHANELIMRGDKDLRPSPVFKLQTIFKFTDPVFMVFDDRKDIVDHLILNGIMATRFIKK